MPTYPPALDLPRNTTRRLEVALLAAGGDDTSVTLDNLDAGVTGLQMADFRDAIGDASNAAVIADSFSTKVEVNKASALIAPLDESYSSASTKAIFVFQNDTLQERSVSVPAPDETLFESDGVTVNPTNAQAAAVISTALALINTGTPAGTFAYLRGYRSNQSRRTPRKRTVKSSIEPGATTLPPQEPGV